jgi:integrase
MKQFKPKTAKAKPAISWRTLKRYPNVQERRVNGKADGTCRVRLTKMVSGTDGKPLMVESKSGKLRPKREEYIKFYDSKQAAIDAVAAAKVEFYAEQEPVEPVTNVTFREFAKSFSDAYLFAPVYESNPNKAKHEKIEGLAGYKDGLRAMAMFTEVFGDRIIRTIEGEEIKEWKAKRYATKRSNGQQRTLASVNRELSFLSKAFGYAVRKKWLDRNPFAGARLINIRHEHKREINITFAEEKKLLDAAIDFPLLRMLLVFLIDTGLRVGEAQKLRRGMIRLHEGIRGHIYLPAQITKGKERRDLPILTTRLRQVIEERLAMIPDDPDALVFGTETVRNAFDAVRERANLERDIELRDTRHTWISRAVPSGIPLPEAMLYSGHKIVDTFLRYLQPSVNEHNANASRFEAFMIAHQIEQPMTSAQVN